MFKEMQQAKHAYIKAKNPKQNFKRQQADIKLKQNQFDKCVKRKKRALNQERRKEQNGFEKVDPVWTIFHSW